MLIDLHVHSYLSGDCQLDPGLILKRAETLGLDGVAFTETNTQDGCEELLALQQKSPVRIFVGMELATDKGHFLCFFLQPHLVPDPVQVFGSNRGRAWAAAEILPQMKAMGAQIVAARPFDRDLPSAPRDAIRNMDFLAAIEVYNPKVRPGGNEAALLTATAMRLPGVAGSDAKQGLDELGTAATLFLGEVRTQADLVDALAQGEMFPVQMGSLPSVRAPGDPLLEESRNNRSGRRRRGRNKGN